MLSYLLKPGLVRLRRTSLTINLLPVRFGAIRLGQTRLARRLQFSRSINPKKLGIIVHIRVDGLRMHNPRGEVVPSIGHMPFTRDAMLVSATNLLRKEKTLPAMEGYEYWRDHCGGVYTISIADAVDVAEKTLNRQ